MICPYCNAQISDGTKFCENCGSALLVDTPITSPAEPAAADSLAAQPANPAQAYQQPAYGAPSQPQAQPYATGQPYGQTPIPLSTQHASTQAQPSAVPFVLAIIALVCAILGLFPVSIILAIVALVMNSGQKKRGEFSTKQMPTFVMGIISLVLSILVAIAIFVLGAAVMAVIQNGEADGIDNFIEEVVASQTAGGTATGAAGAGTGATGATTASYAGTWEIDSMYTDGEEVDPEDIELMQSMGLNVTLELNADGTASLDMFGEELTGGTWKDLGSGNLSLEFEGEAIPMTYDGTLLTLRDGSDWLSFRKA